MASPKERIQAAIDRYHTWPVEGIFDNLVFKTLRLISATIKSAESDGAEAAAVFELPVLRGFCNAGGNMHGGAIALVADVTTGMTAAAIEEPTFWMFHGTTRTLNITVLRPIPVDSTIRVETLIRSAGRRMMAIQGTFRDKETGKVLALAEHGLAARADQIRSGSSESKL